MNRTACEVQHQDWQVDALWRQLSPLLPGIGIEVMAQTDSTNSALLDRVRDSAARESGRGSPGSRDDKLNCRRRCEDLQPCLLVAEHQTRGRGRLGRSWQSGPSGALTFSLGLPLELVDWSGLSLAVGCAIADALDPLADAMQTPRLQLKWPNDLWLHGRKLGGILIATLPAGAQRMVVIGVGLNLAELTPDADAAPSQFATGFAALDELGSQPGAWRAPEVLAQVAPALVQALLDFTQAGFAGWQARYARRDLLFGRPITAGTQAGIARGVNARGELLLQTAAGVQTVSGGEISVRLATPGNFAATNTGVGL